MALKFIEIKVVGGWENKGSGEGSMTQAFPVLNAFEGNTFLTAVREGIPKSGSLCHFFMF